MHFFFFLIIPKKNLGWVGFLKLKLVFFLQILYSADRNRRYRWPCYGLHVGQTSNMVLHGLMQLTCSVSNPFGQSFRKPLCLQKHTRKRVSYLFILVCTENNILGIDPRGGGISGKTTVFCDKLPQDSKNWTRFRPSFFLLPRSFMFLSNIKYFINVVFIVR